MQARRRAAFSFAEVLIVFVIIVVIAAAVIPQLSTSTRDNNLSAGQFHTHTLRSHIELYKSEHAGRVPSGTLLELTTTTDFDGTCNPASGTRGPYLDAIPVNPMTRTNTVKQVSSHPITADDLTGGNEGWLYNPETGDLRANHVDMINF